MQYSIYEIATGRIVKVTTCSPANIEFQYDAAIESHVDGNFSDLEYYIENGEPVLMGDSPSQNHTFNYTTMQWEDLRSLEQLQDNQWELIKAQRVAYVGSPLPTPYGLFDCDPASRSSITDAVILLQTLAGMGQTPTIDFTLADNTVVVMSLESMVTVGLLVGQRVQEGFTIGRLRRDAIYAVTTKEEIEAVVW